MSASESGSEEDTGAQGAGVSWLMVTRAGAELVNIVPFFKNPPRRLLSDIANENRGSGDSGEVAWQASGHVDTDFLIFVIIHPFFGNIISVQFLKAASSE